MTSLGLGRRPGIVPREAVRFSAGAVGAAFGGGRQDDGHERAIPAGEVGRAARVAVQEIDEGTLTHTEVDDEESRYEVEMTLEDGTQSEVQLDEQFSVVDIQRESLIDQPDTD